MQAEQDTLAAIARRSSRLNNTSIDTEGNEGVFLHRS
jgi:hypothetical protein